MLWSIFEGVRAGLKARGLITQSDLFSRLASKLRGNAHPPFEFTVVDEAQDISVAQLEFLSAAGSALFFAGDLGQRIFQQPFSWKALGVDVRGRSSTLRINYRTSHQIRMQADRLLGPELSDVDGNTENRKGTVSTFNGPSPEVLVVETSAAEINAVSDWLTARSREASSPMKSAPSSAPRLNWPGRARRWKVQRSLTKCSTTPSRRPVAGLRSARCISPSAWNSVRSL